MAIQIPLRLVFNAAVRTLWHNEPVPNVIDSLFKKTGNPQTSWFRIGPYKSWFFTRPEDVHEILVKKAKQLDRPPKIRLALKFHDADNVFSSAGTGPLWHRQRKSIAPFLSKTGARVDPAIMKRIIEDHLDGWENRSDIVLADELAQMTLKVLCGTAFNIGINNEEARQISHAIDVPQKHMFWFSVIPEAERFHNFFLSNPYLQDALSVVNSFIGREVERRMRANEPGNDLLGNLMRDTGYLENRCRETCEALLSEAAVVIGAGHETLRTSLYWAFRLLSLHPQIQDKLSREAATGGIPDTAARVEGKPMLLAKKVLAESMRLYPPIYAIFRTAAEDTVIGGETVEKGSYITIPYFSLHRDPAYFTAPGAFDPEKNFDEGAIAARPLHVFGPFSFGPRACPGKGMALQEGCMILSAAARRFSFLPAPEANESGAGALTLTNREQRLQIRKRAPMQTPEPAL